jgi:hypothetical protein
VTEAGFAEGEAAVAWGAAEFVWTMVGAGLGPGGLAATAGTRGAVETVAGVSGRGGSSIGHVAGETDQSVS